MKAVVEAMYLHLKDYSDADNDNGNSNNNHDVVVLTGKEVDVNDEGNTLEYSSHGSINWQEASQIA